jgi:hypothetical protein
MDNDLKTKGFYRKFNIAPAMQAIALYQNYAPEENL